MNGMAVKKLKALNNQPEQAALPMSRREMEERGWSEVDVLLVTGDAYIDHPSFGVALLGRWLCSKGYRVGIVAQPRWDNTTDFKVMGRPRLFVGVTAGTIDSQLAHYTAFRKKRSDDSYTPGGKSGARPNRASIVYTNRIRQAFPGLPVVLGGIEASLRRASHYDFWADKIRRSILLDSKADLLVYGMAERAILEIAQALASVQDSGLEPREALRGIRGTVCLMPSLQALQEAPYTAGAEIRVLPSHEEIVEDRHKLMKATLTIEQQVHQGTFWAVQQTDKRQLVLAPPAEHLKTAELDALYALPYTRRAHPRYTEEIPAARMIQFSVTSHRGCAGGCSFCSITLHQGREISSRSATSIENEVRAMTRHPDWRGCISDVGGPTANMWGAYCADDASKCRRADCLTPTICPHFRSDEKEQVKLLRQLCQVDGVKNVRIASGVRYDLGADEDGYLRALVSEFVGGQLKIAPEHQNDKVLKLMRKPKFEKFERFLALFEEQSAEAGKEQYVIPYLITAFPGCTDEDMHALAKWLRERNWKPRQVQCFIPTPGTVATAMYYARTDTRGRPIYVARTDKARLRQHGILVSDRQSHGQKTSPKPKRSANKRRVRKKRVRRS
jgi:uncharacterized radical SAM protein YgiQ